MKKIAVDNAGKSLKYTDRQYKEINFHLLAIGRNLNQLVKTANYLRVQLNKKDTEIREQEMKSACMADKKDTEKKEFNWKIISAASFVLMTAVGIGTAALGGKFDIKLLKKQ